MTVPQCPSAPVRDERVGFPTPPEPDGGNKFPSTIARGDSPCAHPVVSVPLQQWQPRPGHRWHQPRRWRPGLPTQGYRDSHHPTLPTSPAVPGRWRYRYGARPPSPERHDPQSPATWPDSWASRLPIRTSASHRAPDVRRRSGHGKTSHPRSRWALGDRHARRPRAYALITRVPTSADVEFVIIAKDQRSVIEGNRPTTGESPVTPVRTALGDHIAVIGDDDPRTAQTRIFYLPRTPRSAHAHPCTHRNPSTMPSLATHSPHVLHLPRPHLGLAPTTLGRDNTTSSRMVSRVSITVE